MDGMESQIGSQLSDKQKSVLHIPSADSSFLGSLSGILRVKFVDNQQPTKEDEKYVIYVFEVENLSTHEKTKIHRRYNQFRNLHKELVTQFGDKIKHINLPPKKLWGNFSRDFVVQRAQQLEEYIDALLNESTLTTCELVTNFLDPKFDVETGVSASMWSHPDIEGQLIKQGHLVKSWRPRWFILQGSMLFYFDKKPDKTSQPLGLLSLGYCAIDVQQSSSVWQLLFDLADTNKSDTHTPQISPRNNVSTTSFIGTPQTQRTPAATPGSIPLRNHSAPAKPSEKAPRSLIIEIKISEYSEYDKDLLLQASDETELRNWITKLRAARNNHFMKDNLLKMSTEEEDEYSVLNEFAIRTKTHDRLSSYVQTIKEKKVGMIASRFNIMEFSQKNEPDAKEKASVLASLFDKDSEKNILYHSSDEKDLSIKGATVDKLIQKLTDNTTTDAWYILAFLLTYRSFTTPIYLLDKLSQLFKYWPEKPVKKVEGGKPEATRFTVQLRVCVVLKKWLDAHFYDFIEDIELTNKLLTFIEVNLLNAKEEDLRKTGEAIKLAIRKKIKTQEGQAPVVDPEAQEAQMKSFPPSIVPFEFNPETCIFLDIHPVEIARQLSIIEYNLFKQITPKEFLNQKWNSKDQKEALAPGIINCIKHFNRMSFWTTSSIVKIKNVKARAALIKRFIDVADQCLKLNNFTSCVEIISGLESAPIFRLKKTWELVPLDGSETFTRLKDVMSPGKNYKEYREQLAKAVGACVPYLGVYLQDLTFIEDGNPEYIKGTDLVNFEKRTMIAKVIMQVQQFQQLPYSLHTHPGIQNYLSNLPYLHEAETYKLSLECEPRETVS